MISIAGSVQGYVKELDLRFKAELKKRNSQQSNDEAQFSQKSIAAEVDRFREEYKHSGIVNKMTLGHKLSDSELEYLRQKHPDLHAKAVRIKQEREAYEKEMKRCKTKEEARRANMGKICALAHSYRTAEARNDGGAAAEASMKAKAVDDEHIKFIKSGDYAMLPKDYEELKERRRKYKKTVNEGVIVQISANLLRRRDYQFTVESQKANKKSISGKRLLNPHYDRKV